MNSKVVRDGYNTVATSYARFRDPFKNQPYLESLVRLLKPSSEILDVGCGGGIPIDDYLIKFGHKITGLDLSAEQVRLARMNVPGATYKVQDMSELEDREYQVAAVVSFYAIFHIPRQQHASLLSKFASFLPQGGYLLITMGSSTWQGTEDFLGAPMFWSHYGKNTNARLVRKAGFKILINEIDQSGQEKHQVILAEKR